MYAENTSRNTSCTCTRFLQVDCSFTLEDISGKKLDNALMWRQNEQNQVVVYGKVPTAGSYSLYVFGDFWDKNTDSRPHLATYLVTATSGASDDEGFPTKRIGQTKANQT